MQGRVKNAGRALGAMFAIFAIGAAAACGSDSATGPDNTPASVTANGTVPASAVTSSPVTPPPSVIVKNSKGAPMPNVRVTFVVTAGGGTTSGASQLTDASGIATVEDWTLGDAPGAQTLTATAGGKTVVFTVNATNSCTITGAIAAGATVTGNLATAACSMGDGTAAQSWSFQQATGQAALSFVMHSTGGPLFDTVLLLHRDAFTRFEQVVAGNDDDPSGTTTDSRLNIILTPANYVLTANNYQPGETGPFTIAASAWSGDFANCDEDYVTPGVTTNQALDLTCRNTSTGQSFDYAGVYLAQGQTVQVDMTSAAFAPRLDVYNANTGDLVAQDLNADGGATATATYTVPARGIFVIVATSQLASKTGAYTLSVNTVTAPPVAPALTAPSAGEVRERGTAAKDGRTAFGWPATRWQQGH